MSAFEKLNLSRQLLHAVEDLGFEKPTPIQEEAFPVVLSGKDLVGIAQTGTGKTYAYILPLLQNLKYSKQIDPRVLILVPTRELVLQVVEMIESLSTYISVRVIGVYGGTNINTQKLAVAEGADIIIATLGRLYDLVISKALHLRGISKLVIDEVDVMLDLGFRFQLTNIFELLPDRRQNIMFSATMTDDVENLIDDFFSTPVKISIAVSGTPLNNIIQEAYQAQNFYTKANLLTHLLSDKEEFSKVLVFVSNKKVADRLFDTLTESIVSGICIIHSNKSQNYRIRSVEEFDEGSKRILIATDVIARGLDLEKITHVINFDTPQFPENYMHRIGRTGRAEQQGKAILFFNEQERVSMAAIEGLMDQKIFVNTFPLEVEITAQLTPEERPKVCENKHYNRNDKSKDLGDSFHEKKDKNKKENLGGSYLRTLKKKYKKPRKKGNNTSNNSKKRA